MRPRKRSDGGFSRFRQPARAQQKLSRVSPAPLRAVVGPPPEDGAGVDADVVDAGGRIVVRLEGYRTVVLAVGAEAGSVVTIMLRH